MIYNTDLLGNLHEIAILNFLIPAKRHALVYINMCYICMCVSQCHTVLKTDLTVSVDSNSILLFYWKGFVFRKTIRLFVENALAWIL